jgi:drug/metabolite transporter (DMT)-like permease
VNRGTLVDMGVLESTFLQLLVSSLVLVALVLGLGAAPGQIPAAAVLYFGLAGLVHFLGGWTLLNRSQQLLGAARTSPLLASVPLFGTVLALAVLREVPSLAAVLGMTTIGAGVYVVQLDRARRQARSAAAAEAPSAEATGGGWRKALASSRFGLGAALCWSISPVFIRRGLDAMDAPMVGVTLGLIAATLAYGVLLAARRRAPWRGVPARTMSWKIVAGVLVGFATWTRWYALSLNPVTVVLSLGLLSVPTVIALAPLLAGRHLEQVTRAVVLGSALVVVGALVLAVPGVRSPM